MEAGGILFAAFARAVTEKIRVAGDDPPGVLVRRGVHITALKAPWFFVGKPLIVFLRKYIWQQGFREGLHGLILSGMAAFVTFVNYAKLWEADLPGGRAAHGR